MRLYSQDLLEKLNEIEIIREGELEIIVKPIPDDDKKQVLDPRVLARVKDRGEPDISLFYQNEREDICLIPLEEYRSQMGFPNEDLTEGEVPVKTRLIPVDNHYINVHIYGETGMGQEKPTVIYFHGGGFHGGSAATLDHQCQLLAEKSEGIVISADYRLAPENPFPAGLDDCMGTIEWVCKNFRELGTDPRNINVAGDSAGANLAVACCLKDHEKRIRRVMSIYGALELGLAEETPYGWDYSLYGINEEQKDYIMGRLYRFKKMMQIANPLYLQGRISPSEPLVSPLYAENLENLPPVVIFEAEFDYFRICNDLFAQKLLTRGKQVEVIRYAGMDHGFFDRLGTHPQTEDCILEMARYLRK